MTNPAVRTARAPILLIGRSGQIAWELQRTLAVLGRVVAVDRATLDLAQTDQIRALVRSTAPGLIVNAAAHTAVDRAEEEPALAYAINAAAPGVLAEEAARQGIGLVHYSTDYVFDGAAPLGDDGMPRAYNEEDPTAPQGVYGASKRAGEEAIAASGAVHLIFRTSWVYAARGRNFLLTMLRLGAERPQLRIVDDQRGAPTWARSIAEATAAVLAGTWARGGTAALVERSGLYHLSAEGQTSWFGFAQAIFAGIDPRPASLPELIPIPTSAYPTPARRPAFSVLDSARSRAAFGIGIGPWEDDLRLCLDELAARRG